LLSVLLFGASCFAAPGDLKWTFVAFPTPDAGLSTSPALLSDGTILIVAPGQALFAVKPSGQELWHYAPVGGQQGAPVVGPGDHVHVGGSHLQALGDRSSLRWSVPSPSGQGFDVPVLGAGGTVYSVDGDGRLYALRADGTLRWVASAQQPAISSPVLGRDGSLYVASRQAQQPHAIRPDGQRAWEFPAGTGLVGSPAIGPDGAVKGVTNAQRLATLGAKTNYTDVCARAGVEYQYWIRALNSQGAGPFSLPAPGSGSTASALRHRQPAN